MGATCMSAPAARSARPEAPEEIEAAELAAAELAKTLEAEPRLATTDYLDDRVGAAVRRREQALGDDAGSRLPPRSRRPCPPWTRWRPKIERLPGDP